MEDNKIKAAVGIAKCPKTNQLYGVRVEEINGKWCATWAFPIKSEVAKREGYTVNQFPKGLIYDPQYPGCPYCHSKEDLAALTAQMSKRALKVVVTSPNFDNIGKILSSLKINYESFLKAGFNCDLLFLNCGTSDNIDSAGLRKFVESGGCVYASDLTDDIISRAFPGYFNFEGHVGEECKIYADVVDTELREIVGNKIMIEFDMPIWAVLRGSRGQTLLAGAKGSDYAGLPIMVKVPFGKGIIFYTCFHNHAQASEKERALLQLLVLKQIGSNSNSSIEDAGASIGIDVNAIKAMFRSNF